ncbi:hypothetical protein [uncultured Selenomonas sp.]|uniref:hypothetical protein n=1 Tax=uncultured Selenomonas sp. TaxID=159275 RepID=UPI0025DF70D8|nr:hypothetical protein [uncultured Selenomonas sp.]
MKRFRLDLLLAVLFVLVMGFRMLPPMLHEVFGLGMLVAVAIHIFWNARWFSALGRGGWRRLRVVQTLLNVFLHLSTGTALVTGIIISNHVLRPLLSSVPLHSSIFVHQLHVASACVMLAFLGMHVGMHWAGLWARMKTWPVLRSLDARSTLRFWVLVLLGWAGCAYARLDHFGDRMMMRHVFKTPAGDLPVPVAYLMLACLIGLYAIAFFYLQKRLARKGAAKANLAKGGVASSIDA